MSDEYTKYPRGSEWRRWDLHIHTPDTGKNDKFKGNTSEEKWKNYNESINTYCGEIIAVGVTDYMSTDNYFKFKKFVEDKKIKKRFDLILPNVELRLIPVAKGGKALNAHCIFNPSFESDIERRFFAELKFNFNGRDYGADRPSLIQLGKALSGDGTLQDDAYIQKARDQFVIEPSKLRKLFDRDTELRENCLIVVANGSGDGASGITKHKDNFTNAQGKSTLDATKKSIYQMADAIFSSNEGDSNYFCGLGVDCAEKVIKEAGSLMPCFHGSDAHKNDDVFEPAGRRYCWIKADPTFEGLKQVLHEPRERVKIQEGNPNEKSGYKVIERIERYKTLDDLEPFQTIHLNPNLNCIIGGRSTGKSVLARSIAYRMDCEDTRLEREEQAYKDWFISETERLRVIWTGDSDESKREVEYYPQSFMYDIARDDTLRNKLVQDILKQHGKSHYIEEHSQKENEISEDINKLITNLFSQIRILETKKTSLRQLGERQGVEKEITKLKEELVANGGASLSSAEQESYNEQIALIRKHEATIGSLKKDLDEIKLLRSERVMNHNLDQRIKLLSGEKAIETLQLGLQEISANAQNSWEEKIDALVDTYQVDIKKSEDIIASIKKQKGYLKATEALSKTTLSNSIQKRLNEQEKILADISSLSQEIDNLEGNITGLREEVLAKHGEFETVGDEYSKKINLESSGLTISSHLQIKHDKLQEAWENVVSQKTAKAKDLSSAAAKTFLFRRLTSENFFKPALEAILNNEVSIKGSFNTETGLKHLFAQSPFHLDYDIQYESDSYKQMSDGKRAFVILKLLLEFSDRTCPIILDQPEDDLDNRSIYTDLVSYLKQKKRDRQIIVVTHNANIAVGADSELIIVANQDSQKTKNKTGEKFEYLGGSIEHSFPYNAQIDFTLGSQGTREHVCEILEGGNEAFKVREKKYGIK